MVPNDELPKFGNSHYFELRDTEIAIEEDGEVMDRKHLTHDSWGEENKLMLMEDINDPLETANPEHMYRINRHPAPDC
jgi:hypothetical protein